MIHIPSYYRKVGSLSVSAQDQLRRIDDIARTFSINPKLVRRGFTRKGGYDWRMMHIWWPKPQSMIDSRRRGPQWRNDFLLNDTRIEEWNDDLIETRNSIAREAQLRRNRIVFKCEKHKTEGYCYRVIGEFEFDVAASAQLHKLVWKRVGGDQVIL